MKRLLALSLVLCLLTFPVYAVLPTPVTLGPVINGILGTLGGLLGIGGLAVSDNVSHGQLTAVIAEQQRTYKEIQAQLAHMKKMAERLTKIPTQAQWPPWIKATARDTYGRNAGWTGNLNGTLDRYLQSVYNKVPELASVLDRLTAEAQERLKQRYSNVELADGLNQESLNVIGMIRDRVPQAEHTLGEIEGIAYSNTDTDNTDTARLQLISQAGVVQARTQQDSNKLLVQLVQQQALVSSQVRDQQTMHFEQLVGQVQGLGIASSYLGDPVAEAKGFRW